MVVLTLCCGSVSAQSALAKMLMDTPYTKVVLSDIEAQVLTPNSKYFYPKLYERYEKNDTTLNLEDYRHLYYGYMFQAEYTPHTESVYVDSLSMLLNRDGGVFKLESVSNAVKYMEKILDDRPFSLKFLNMMSYVYDSKLNSPELSMRYSYKFNMLLSAIFSSGTGTVKELPWQVLYRSDAQSILLFLGVDVTRRVYITTTCEYYHIREKQGDAKGYYFDFEPIYSRPMEPKGKRKMEFNPLSNPKSDKYINRKL